MTAPHDGSGDAPGEDVGDTRPDHAEPTDVWAAPPPTSSWGPPAGTGGWGGPPVSPRSDLATPALVLGILGVVFVPMGFALQLLSRTVVPLAAAGAVLAVLAVVLGIVGRRRATRGETGNRGSATAGIVLGLLGVLVAVAAGVVVGLSLHRAATTGGVTDRAGLAQCVNQAHGQRAAVRRCREQYGAVARPGRTT